MQAFDAVASSDYATTAAAPFLAAPTGLQVTAISGSAVHLQWVDNSANESGYSILELVHGDWLEIGEADPNATRGTAEGTFEPSTEYSFRVRAWSDWSDSWPSNIVQATPVIWPPTPVTNLIMDSFSVNAQGQISVEYTIDGQNAAPSALASIARPTAQRPATLLQTIEVDDPSQLIGGGASRRDCRCCLGAIHRSGLSTGQAGQPQRSLSAG